MKLFYLDFMTWLSNEKNKTIFKINNNSIKINNNKNIIIDWTGKKT